MSEPVGAFNVLFGSDGTQLPDPSPVPCDPLTGPVRSSWLDIAQLPAVPLPPVPDGREMHAAIAAVYGEGPSTQALTPNRSPPPAPEPRVIPPLRSFPPSPHRVGQEPAGQPRHRSDSGVRTGCVIALIIIGVIAFNIIAAIVQAISALFS